jgi:hypothetical protein
MLPPSLCGGGIVVVASLPEELALASLLSGGGGVNPLRDSGEPQCTTNKAKTGRRSR